MATHIVTSFEEYADGAGANEYDTLVDPTAGMGYGWFGGVYDPIPGEVRVISSDAHTGAKSVQNEGGSLPWHPQGGANSDRCLTVEAWFKPGGVGATRGPKISVSSAVGVDGVSRWPIDVGALGSGPGIDLEVWVMDVLLGTVAGAFGSGSYQKLRTQIQFSTVEAGGADINPDGFVKAYVDDVQVFDSGLTKVATNSVGWAGLDNDWFEVSFRVNGYIDDVSIVSSATACSGSDAPPPDDSDPCCGAGPDPDNPNPSSTPNPGDTPIPLQPWTPQCAGGGTVPFSGDVSDAESWAL